MNCHLTTLLTRSLLTTTWLMPALRQKQRSKHLQILTDMTVYGIPNCNTVKKAVDWLKHNETTFEFHDYKKKGITAEKLKKWSKELGWEALVNKKGTTWRT